MNTGRSWKSIVGKSNLESNLDSVELREDDLLEFQRIEKEDRKSEQGEKRPRGRQKGLTLVNKMVAGHSKAPSERDDARDFELE